METSPAIGVAPVHLEASRRQLTPGQLVILKGVHERFSRTGPVCRQDLEAELQIVLAILADVDRAYEELRHRVDSWSGPITRKVHLRGQLEKLHKRDREKWCARLAHLHNRITDLTTLPGLITKVSGDHVPLAALRVTGTDLGNAEASAGAVSAYPLRAPKTACSGL